MNKWIVTSKWTLNGSFIIPFRVCDVISSGTVSFHFVHLYRPLDQFIPSWHLERFFNHVIFRLTLLLRVLIYNFYTPKFFYNHLLNEALQNETKVSDGKLEMMECMSFYFLIILNASVQDYSILLRLKNTNGMEITHRWDSKPELQ